jgi:hypothetical protein
MEEHGKGNTVGSSSEVVGKAAMTAFSCLERRQNETRYYLLCQKFWFCGIVYSFPPAINVVTAVITTNHGP